MHDTAKKNCNYFINCYKGCFNMPTIVDIGSMDVNGSLRDCVGFDVNYTGVDFSSGKNVDKVLDDPSVLPFEDESVDMVLCSSVFEHSIFFW